MKVSRYNYKMTLDDQRMIYFNTFTRGYVLGKLENENEIESILNGLNKDKFTYEESQIIRTMASQGLIINDNEDELEKVKFHEKNSIFQDQHFILTILPTLDCNFRCVYCYEQLKPVYMQKEGIEKILAFVKQITAKVNRLTINWFGGEPLLMAAQIEKMSASIKEICDENHCRYDSALITNGALLTESTLEKLSVLNLKKVQITLDGLKHHHDLSRPFANGKGSFDEVFNSIMTALKFDFYVTLRINISGDNVGDVYEIMNMIPENLRNKVIISIANLFQNANKINLYDLYKKSIEMGFMFTNFFSRASVCEGGIKNAMVIDPNGKVSSCSMATEKGLYIGELGNDGGLKVTNASFMYKLRNQLASESELCGECIKLPVCYGGCKVNRLLNKQVCNWGNPTGMTLEDRIKLQYAFDARNGRVDESRYL